MIHVSADPDSPPTVFTMGLGTVVVATVLNEGMPGLYFCPARKPGLVDSDATSEVADKPVAANAVVIRFANMDAVVAHLERLNSMVRDFEAEWKKAKP